MGGFYRAFGPSIAENQLGSTSALMAAVVLFSHPMPNAIGGPMTARLTPANAQRIGIVVYTLGVLGVPGILFSLMHSILARFWGSSVFAGTAQDAVLPGSTRSLLKDITPQDRAGAISLIYATSYTGAAVPSLIAGELSHFINLFQFAVFCAALAVIACSIILPSERNPRQDVLRLEKDGVA